MDGKKINAIILQGINHNLDKIGVEDGMCEDLINLRYKDGSWRTTGEGKLVYQFGSKTYTNMYVHTNVYRHVLGSRHYYDENGIKRTGLYWFANIDEEGLFTTIQEVRICDAPATEEFIYSQTGHLLIVLSSSVRTTLFFNRGEGVYKEEEVLNGNDAYSHPLGTVKFKVVDRLDGSGRHKLLYCPTKASPCNDSSIYEASKYDDSKVFAKDAYSQMQTALKKEGSFGGAFLVCLAVKLYSGDWTWASAPTIVYPSYMGDNKMEAKGEDGYDWQGKTYLRELENPVYIISRGDIEPEDNESTSVLDTEPFVYRGSYTRKYNHVPAIDLSKERRLTSGVTDYNSGMAKWEQLPTIGDCFWRPYENGDASYRPILYDKVTRTKEHLVWGKLNDLYVNLSEIKIQSTTIYKSIGVFVTPLIGGNGNPLDLQNITFNDDQNYTCIELMSQVGYNYSSWVHNLPAAVTQRYNENEYFSAKVYLTKPSSYLGMVSCWKPRHIMSKKEWDKDDDEVRNALKSSQFYLIKEIPVDSWKTELAEHGDGYWKKIELDESDLMNVGVDASALLPANAFDSVSFTHAEYGMTFNGRLHLANYRKSSATVWGNSHIIDRDYSSGSRRYTENVEEHVGVHESRSTTYSFDECYNAAINDSIIMNNTVPYIYGINNFNDQVHTADNVFVGTSNEKTSTSSSMWNVFLGNDIISTFIPFPSLKIDSMQIYINNTVSTSSSKTYKSKKTEVLQFGDQNEMLHYALRFYFDFKDDDYDYETISDSKYQFPKDLDILIQEGEVDVPNGILVSGANTPTYFKDEYLVGSSEIVALAANSIAVGTGQTGDVPLYVFSKDGVYGLFIDASGEIAYSTSRVLARDVISNPKSVKAIDNGVVFVTKRGLMLMSGDKAVEIGQPVEGDWCEFGDSESPDFDKIADNAYKMNLIANINADTQIDEDFLSYVNNANTIINYNHNERELIVCNTNKDYSYVMDRDGNWSRRSYTADEFVDNFPTSYRVKNGKFYKVDEDPNSDNGFFILTRELKLDSIGFKELNRFVARGFFDTCQITASKEATISPGYGDVEIDVTSVSEGTVKITPSDSIAYTVSFINSEGTAESKGTSGGVRTFNVQSGNKIKKIVITRDSHGGQSKYTVQYPTRSYVGLYVYGSYDGRRWTLLGHKEKNGSFNDIGCVVERSDCKFFRFVLAGRIKSTSRIDYFETSSKQSKLSQKIR